MPETTLAQDLRELRQLKDKAEEIGRSKTTADGEFKQKQSRVLARMQAEEADSFRTAGYLFTAIADRVKGQVDDRRRFVRWALEQDEAIQELLEQHLGMADKCGYDQVGCDGLADAFYEAIMNTTLVTYKENGTACNSMAKAHVDDERPLPPGLNFRPDPYIQQLKS